MNKIKYLGVGGVFLGILLSRFLGDYFGLNSTIIVLSICIIGLLGIIIYSLFIKKSLGAIVFIILTMPLLLGAVGIYLENSSLVSISLLFLIIGIPVIIIFLKKIDKMKSNQRF